MRSISSEVVPADVADPELVGSGADGDAERIAEPVARRCGRRRATETRSADCRGARRRSAGRRAGSCRRRSRIRSRSGRGPASAARRPRRSAASGCRPRRRADRRTGFTGEADLAVVDAGEARAVAAAHVERAVGAERQRADRVARELLAPVLDEDVLAARHDVAGGGETREASADDAAGGVRAGRVRAPVEGRARRAPARRRLRRAPRPACRGRRRTASPGSRGAAPGRAVRGPRSCGRWFADRRRSSVSARRGSSNTLMMPLFSATKTRPSAAKRTAVGEVRPVKTVVASNPEGSTMAVALRLPTRTAATARSIRATDRMCAMRSGYMAGHDPRGRPDLGSKRCAAAVACIDGGPRPPGVHLGDTARRDAPRNRRGGCGV